MLALAAAWVASGTPAVAKYQRRCGVTAEGPTNPILHPIFSIGSAMGNELFFLIFFPCIICGFDAEVSRRTMVCWASIYYLGQALKDAWRLPRPPASVKLSQAHLCAACPARCGGARCGGRAAPAPAPAAAPGAPGAAVAPPPLAAKGVVCLETHYAAEYGMPSTHAMCSVGLPWALVAWTVRSGRFQGDITPLAAFAGFYTFATTLSRPYMGVHSPADVLVGLALGVAILALDLRVGEAVDAWVMHHPAAPLALPALLIVLMAVYPRPPKWKSSPGDTMLVVAATFGVLLASALDSPRQLRAQGGFALPSALPLSSWSAAGAAQLLLRCAAVTAACAATRAVLKPLCVGLLSALLGPAYGDAGEISAAARVGDTPMHIIQGTALEPPSPAGFGRSSSTQWAASSSSSSSSMSQEGGGALGVHRRHGSAAAAAAAAAVSSADASREVAPTVAAPYSKEGEEEGAGAAATSAAAAAADDSGPSKRPEPLTIRSPREAVLVPPEQRYAIELPTKMVVYGAIGFCTMYICPRLIQAITF